jgi:hypothetical protein
VDALRASEGLRVILFTDTDLGYALDPEHRLERVLAAKVWRAATHGDPLWLYQSQLNESIDVR